MGYLSHFLYPLDLLLQGLAIIHFIRRRPNTYWTYVVFVSRSAPSKIILGDLFRR